MVEREDGRGNKEREQQRRQSEPKAVEEERGWRKEEPDEEESRGRRRLTEGWSVGGIEEDKGQRKSDAIWEYNKRSVGGI